MTHDYKGTLEGIEWKMNDGSFTNAEKLAIISSLQLAQEAEQHKAEKEAMRRVLDGSKVLLQINSDAIEQLRKERDDALIAKAELLYALDLVMYCDNGKPEWDDARIVRDNYKPSKDEE